MKFEDGGRVSWSKKERARARKEKRYLFVMGFSGVDAKIDGEIVAMGGIDDKELILKIRALISEFSKKRKPGDAP